MFFSNPNHAHRLDDDSLKQQELLYHQDFFVQQLDRKLRRAQGERSDEEKQILTQRIEELTKSLDAITTKWNLLTGHVKRSQDEAKYARRRLEVVEKKRESAQNAIAELTLYIDSAVCCLVNLFNSPFRSFV